MLTSSLKLYLAGVAVLIALVVLLADRTIAQGTGLIVATLAAGAGWLIRDMNDETRAVRNICQAYVALIEAQFEEFQDVLSDAELDRFAGLAPEIAAGTQAESIGARTADPYAAVPDLKPHLHLLSAETVRLLTKWRSRGFDLYLIYDQLGTRPLSALSSDRIAAYFEWVKKYRDEYRDISYSALLSLADETSGLRTNTELFEHHNAVRLTDRART